MFTLAAGTAALDVLLCRWLWFEVAAGTVVARLAVNDQLVVMHRPRQQ
jgi:hypothetical protein